MAGAAYSGSADWIVAARIRYVASARPVPRRRRAEPPAVGRGDFRWIGASGAPLQGNCGAALPGQQKAIYGSFGALLLEITSASLVARFVVEDGGVGDVLTLTK